MLFRSAFGHHKDDIIETFFINICYSGQMGTMLPLQSMFDGRLTIIRPMAFADEERIRRFTVDMGFPIFENPCPSAAVSKRAEISAIYRIKTMKDVQNERDHRNIAINKVGIKNLRYPITVLDKNNGEQHTVALINMYVDLPHESKGTHMSRFVELLHLLKPKLSLKIFADILEQMKSYLNAESAHVEVTFPFFIEKKAPATGAPGLMDYTCRLIGSINSKCRVDLVSEVNVPISSVCPCSKEISDFGAHNQRGEVCLSTRFKKFIWIEDMIELAEKADIPIGVTLLGIGGVPASHPLNIGFMGMHGGYGVNHAIQQADLLIACGMRFDDRVTGTLETYSPGSKKIHIEIDPTEINKNVTVDVGIVADLAEALKQINPKVQPGKKKDWLTRIDNWRKESHSRDILNKKSEDLIGAQVVRQIWRQTNGAALVVSDVGQNQMLEAQYYSHDEPNTLITSGGLGTMGFGLPAAIGASFAGRNKDIWVIVGDGGIQMTITELATLVQEKKKINIAILNNGYLGMVRQWQQLFYDARYTETPITGPDFMKIADAYGLKGFRVTKTKDLEKTIQAAQDEAGPCLIEFMIEKMGMVYPMVPAGAGLHDMVKRPTEDQFSKMDI